MRRDRTSRPPEPPTDAEQVSPSRLNQVLRTSIRLALSALTILVVSEAAFAQGAPRVPGDRRLAGHALTPLALPYHSPDSPDRVLVVLLENEHHQGRTYGGLPDMVLGGGRPSVADYLETVSYGRVRVQGLDVYGIYPTFYDTLSGPYDGDAMVEQAMSSLDGDGVVLDWSRYLFFVVVVDDIFDPNHGADLDGDGLPDLPNGGLPAHASVPDGSGSRTIPGIVAAGFLTDSPRAFVDVVCHEYGHTAALDFPHSGSLDCSAAGDDYFHCVADRSTGDRTDIMGDGGYLPGDLPRPYSALRKLQAGWLPAANVGQGAGVHLVFPLDRDLGSGYTQLVIIELAEAPSFDAGAAIGATLSVEYRDGTGYDEGLPAGVYVKLRGASQDWCLTPEPLLPGQSFVDPHNHVSIEVLALNDDSVSVAVEQG